MLARDYELNGTLFKAGAGLTFDRDGAVKAHGTIDIDWSRVPFRGNESDV